MTKTTKAIIIGGSIGVVLATTYIVFKHFQRKSARKVLNEKILKVTQLSLSDAFNPDKWKLHAPKISDATARTAAQKVYDAIGYFSEDEEGIVSAFYAMQNYYDASLISYQYKKLYEKDMYTDIKAAFKGDEQKLAKLRAVIAKKR